MSVGAEKIAVTVAEVRRAFQRVLQPGAMASVVVGGAGS